MESSLNRGNWLKTCRGKTRSHRHFNMFVVEDDKGDSCGMGGPLCCMSASGLALEYKFSEVERILKEEEFYVCCTSLSPVFDIDIYHQTLYHFIFTLMICHMVAPLWGIGQRQRWLRCGILWRNDVAVDITRHCGS